MKVICFKIKKGRSRRWRSVYSTGTYWSIHSSLLSKKPSILTQLRVFITVFTSTGAGDMTYGAGRTNKRYPYPGPWIRIHFLCIRIQQFSECGSGSSLNKFGKNNLMKSFLLLIKKHKTMELVQIYLNFFYTLAVLTNFLAVFTNFLALFLFLFL